MFSQHLTNCCTASVVHGFGGSRIAELGNRKKYRLDELVKDLKEECERRKLRGDAVVIATTNSDQKIANKALKQAGFRHSKWMSKKKHPETKLRVWHKPLEDV